MKLNHYKVLTALGFLFVAACSAGWGYLALGPTALDSTNLKWLWGDLAAVYIAWSQYLFDPNTHWLSTTYLSHPLPISVSHFDPMPLLLLLARPFAGLFEEGQQFFGFYFVACLGLQGAFGYFAALRTMKLVNVKQQGLACYIAVLVGVLFATIPYTFFRFQGHTALSSQWLLALSIWITLETLDAGNCRWMLTNGLVLFATTGINPYFTLMVVTSNSVVVLLHQWKQSFKDVTLRVGFLFIAAAVGLSVFGFMDVAVAPSGGYGVYSMNMLGPLDSNGKAGLLHFDAIDPTGGQTFEGFTYIGLGLLLLGFIVLISYVNYRTPDYNKFPFIPVIAVVACCYMLALSTTVTLSTHSLHLPMPDAVSFLLSRFRSSGRLFWIGGLWLVLIFIAALVLRFGAFRAAVLLTILILVQLVDIHPIALDVRTNIANFKALELSGIGCTENVSAILVYPPWQCDNQETPGGLRNYEMVGYFALHHRIPTNNFYAARNTAEQLNYHCDYDKRLSEIDPNAIYLLSSKLYTKYKATFAQGFNCSVYSESGNSKESFWICVPRY